VLFIGVHMHMKKIVLAMAMLAVAGVAQAQGKLNVVATTEDLASIASEVGGDRIAVESIAKGYQDPHFVEAKPSLQVALNRADLLVHVGLELEIGWLPPLVVGARNPRIQVGQPGNLDASAQIPVLDLPTTRVDRSMGDIHPMGNPHYFIPPQSALIVAQEIAERLALLDAAHAADYRKNLGAFQAEVGRRRVEWERRAAPLRGMKVATYHKSWSYVSQWVGLSEIGYVEPKPGIPPALSHLAQLVSQMKAQGARAVLVESFYSRKTAEEVARLSGAKLVVLPSDVGARADIKDWFSLVDAVVDGLLAAVK